MWDATTRGHGTDATKTTDNESKNNFRSEEMFPRLRNSEYRFCLWSDGIFLCVFRCLAPSTSHILRLHRQARELDLITRRNHAPPSYLCIAGTTKQLPVFPVENGCLARNSSVIIRVIIDLQDNYTNMTSPEELSGKTAVLCAEGYLEPSQIQDADSNTFMGIRDM